MAENFLQRLARNPYAPIDGASVTRVDELGNGYDDWNNLIAPKFEQPQQTWGETALGVATAPARMATALAGSLSPYGQDGWQLPPIIDEGVNALSAVGDAYNYGMDQDEINSRALGMAGFMMGGGGIAARPSGSVAAGLPRVAAARYGDKIYTGANHGEAYAKAVSELGEKTVDDLLMRDGQYDGFLDETGDFIDRLTAQQRANAPSAHAYDILAANASKEGAIPALMNYDVPDVFYHGTPDASFSKFNIDEIRARAPEQNNGFAGVSMSPYPDEASGYASLRGAAPGMFPLRSDATNPFVWNVDDFYDGKMPKYQFGKLKGDEPATLQRLRGVIPDYKFRGGDFPSYGFAMSEALAAAGYDALDIVHGGKLSERAALAPNTVRSATTGETLFSNADSKPALLASGLDMGQEARLARARDMGFDTDASTYRGLRKPYSEEEAKNLYYQMFTANPLEAAEYGSNVVEAYLRKGRNLSVDAGGRNFNAVPTDSLPPEYGLGPVARTDEIAHKARQAGYDSVTFNNVFDNATDTKGYQPKPVKSKAISDDDLLAELGITQDEIAKLAAEPMPATYQGAPQIQPWERRPTTVDVIFDPRNIRSVNAVFDPAKSDSANLLAANADSRPALLGAGQEQDIPDWLLPYLGR